VENFGGHSIPFALIDTTASGACCYTRCVLSTMLEEVKRIVDLDCGSGGVRVPVNDGNDTAHGERTMILEIL